MLYAISRSGTVYIYLVDEEHSGIPLSGVLATVDPGRTETEDGYVSFSFSNLQQGIYGIRCFQDINGNGKLDRGLFGPTEPWGFSWNRQPPSGPPAFSDYCHQVTGVLKNIEIQLSR